MSELYHAAQQQITQLPLFILSKVCTGCHLEKSLDEFYMVSRSNPTPRAQCKECTCKKDREDYHANIEQEHARSHIYYENHKEQVIERTQRNHSLNRERDIAQAIAWHRANREHVNEQKRNRRANPTYRARYLEYYAQWSANNPEKISKYSQKYRQANPHLGREYAMRRHLRKKAVHVGKIDYRRILERDGMWCHICEHPILPHQRMDFDHVIPLSRYGLHCEENIKPSHALCNRRKGSKLLRELTPFQRRGVS